ncbi:hypothetical protein QP166_00895 [Sphingomonas sp. LR60]|uniref:hypothetical protein n=1 Tax=Sphingomonas sp. LR60 TaxID=3050233 RepID=UPI002FE3D556
MNERWTPRIGDPSVIGWVTVALYLIAAGACAMAARRAMHDARGGLRFWAIVAVMMLALGINKQLDLQSLFTQLLRDDALQHGWFAERRTLQLAFIIGLAMASPIIAFFIVRRFPMLRRNMRAAVVGVCSIYTYVLIRAASFHHVDRFINATILGVKWNWVLEIGGIMIVLLAALRARVASCGTSA